MTEPEVDDWAGVEANTITPVWVPNKGYRAPRIIWVPTPEEIELAKDRGCVWCTECADPLETHDRYGCKVCDACPQDWTNAEIRKIRLAHELRWAR